MDGQRDRQTDGRTEGQTSRTTIGGFIWKKEKTTKNGTRNHISLHIRGFNEQCVCWAIPLALPQDVLICLKLLVRLACILLALIRVICFDFSYKHKISFKALSAKNVYKIL